MIESDYEALISYIIDELRSLEAVSIIQQIEELESLKILESEKPRKKKSEPYELFNKEISNSVTRQMTFEEMYHATLEILENYLVTVPIMVKNITKLLKIESGSISWSAEGNNRIDKRRKETSLIDIDILKPENVDEIRNIIDKLKAY